jgi:predicted RNA-binding Zn-ribbon protein involved in translation (DUF1610 family)
MAIEVTCTSCGKTLNAKDSAAGRQAKCPDCGSLISITEPIYDAIEDPVAADEFAQIEEPQPPGDDRQRSPCPLCGEMIITGAAKCRFCGEYLDSTIRGLWRSGDLLVIRKETKLPERCVKSNQPCSRTLTRKLTWHHPALYLILFLTAIIPYVIVALIVQKRAEIEVGLSEEWFARRRRTILIAWLLILGSIAMPFGVSILLNLRGEVVGWSALAAVVIGLGTAIYGVVAARLVSPAEITDTHVWLKGVHPEYLAELPTWDGHSR